MRLGDDGLTRSQRALLDWLDRGAPVSELEAPPLTREMMERQGIPEYFIGQLFPRREETGKAREVGL